MLAGIFQHGVGFLRKAEAQARLLSPKCFSLALHKKLQTLAGQAHVHRNTIGRALQVRCGPAHVPGRSLGKPMVPSGRACVPKMRR